MLVVESYDWIGKHTYLPMGITIGSVLILFVTLVALYNKLAPRPIPGEIRVTNSVPGNLDIEKEGTYAL